MVNFYLLRENENNELLNLLMYEFIKEDFISLINSILRLFSINLNKTNLDQKKFGYNIILTIDKILLDNLYTRIKENKVDHLLYLLQYKLFCNDLYIKSCYIYDLYTDFVDSNIEDCTFYEIEHTIKRMLGSYINYIYNNYTDRYNETFINIIQTFQEELSWAKFNNFRIEILKEKTPAILVTKGLDL